MTSKAVASVRGRAAGVLARWGTFSGLVLLVAVMSLVSPRFLTTSNLLTLLTQVSMLCVVALGETLVLVSGNIDVSTGSVVGLSAVMSALLLTRSFPSELAVATALAVGALLGALNGLTVGYLRVDALIATFATSAVALGLNFWLTKGSAVLLFGEAAKPGFMAIGQGTIWGIPMPFVIMLGAFIVSLIAMEKTAWGLRLRAVGGNPTAASLFGIGNAKAKLQAFVACGTLAALSGVIVAARLGSGSPIAGSSYTLDGIAAAYIGSTMFRQGEPHILGTLLGVLIFGVLTNGFSLLGVGFEVQSIARGLIVVSSVALAATRS